jgi:hypothetical protein
VRRAALEEPQLLANGSNTEALTLEIQVPAGFVAPPVGAGGKG